jgi:hypothetical protein
MFSMLVWSYYAAGHLEFSNGREAAIISTATKNGGDVYVYRSFYEGLVVAAANPTPLSQPSP